MELTHRQQQRERSLVGHSVPVLSLQVAQISFNTAPCLLQLSPPPPAGSPLLSILPSMPSQLECSCLACPVFCLRSLPDVGLGISVSYERSFQWLWFERCVVANPFCIPCTLCERDWICIFISKPLFNSAWVHLGHSSFYRVVMHGIMGG